MKWWYDFYFYVIKQLTIKDIYYFIFLLFPIIIGTVFYLNMTKFEEVGYSLADANNVVVLRNSVKNFNPTIFSFSAEESCYPFQDNYMTVLEEYHSYNSSNPDLNYFCSGSYVNENWNISGKFEILGNNRGNTRALKFIFNETQIDNFKNSNNGEFILLKSMIERFTSEPISNQEFNLFLSSENNRFTHDYLTLEYSVRDSDFIFYLF